MNEQDHVDAMLREAFALMSPYKTGGSDWIDREAALRGKIVAYLGARGKPVTLYGPGGGGGGPATFGVAGGSFNQSSTVSSVGTNGRVENAVMGSGGAGGTLFGPFEVHHEGAIAFCIGQGAASFRMNESSYYETRARELNKPVFIGGGAGGAAPSYGDWMFPDGHTERLPANETPRWPKDNPLRDAIDANP